MAKRKITKLELEAAIRAHGGNVLAIARALNVTAPTVYSTLDAYNMRGDLDAARNKAIESARVAIASAPKRVRLAIQMMAESTGSVELLQLLSEPISTVRPFHRTKQIKQLDGSAE